MSKACAATNSSATALSSGLNGTGDKLNNAVFTRESLIGMLERLGVNTRDQIKSLDTKNVAAVMVTADMAALHGLWRAD